MTWTNPPQEGTGDRPPFSPPFGYFVTLDVFRAQVRVTINKYVKGGKIERVKRFWLSHAEFPGFLSVWHELGASAAMRRDSGRSEAPISVDPESNILPEIEAGDTTTGSGGDNPPTATQLSLDLR